MARAACPERGVAVVFVINKQYDCCNIYEYDASAFVLALEFAL